HAGTKAIQAYNTCNTGKGSCGDAVAEALISTAAIIPGGRLIKGAASGAKVIGATSKGSDDLIQIWRAVGPDEAADVAKSGVYRPGPGLEGKYFFPTKDQAENLARMYTSNNIGGPYTLTSGLVPRSTLQQADAVNAVGEGPGWYLRNSQLPDICNVSCHGLIR
ncbi:hypothetical protein, partial [Sinomonas halotolerans]